ncbi:MAG: flagellar FlbD family protein [Candidatus Sericytochromatia bacterium]|nr:flagellar FlbD family protein [Candidatus Tanganyikabacteria bacterium]
MISVTRLNHTEFVVNAELIETIEATPDTVVTLTSERKYVVRESVDEVVRRVLAYKQACQAPFLQQASAGQGDT